MNSPQKVYLNCKFHEKEECKSKGGRWDNEKMKWFYNPNYITDSSVFDKWRIDSNSNDVNKFKSSSSHDVVNNDFPDNRPNPKRLKAELLLESVSTSNSNVSSLIKKLPPASLEQKAAIDAVVSQKVNVMLMAVAGSGKTTLVLILASLYPNLSILLLTYNKRLKEETRMKAKDSNITNLEAHSYHAMCVKYYNHNASRDTALRNVVVNETAPIQRLPNYDIIVIDEAQDSTEIYFGLVYKIIRDINNQFNRIPQLVILGDEKQCIFRFKEADSRYLTLAAQLYDRVKFITTSQHEMSWQILKLSTSYRVTNKMASFLNEVVTCIPNHIVAIKDSSIPVKYFRGNNFEIAKWIGKEIVQLCQSGKIKPQEIFILAPSIKAKKGPLKIIENILVENNIYVYTATSDEGEISDEIADQKVVFCTFHQSKGLERRVVIVVNFSESYFDYYDKESDRTKCPNTIYVATTRSTEILCLIGEERDGGQFSFLNYKRLIEIHNKNDFNSPLEIINANDLKYNKSCLLNRSNFKLYRPLDSSMHNNYKDNKKFNEQNRLGKPTTLLAGNLTHFLPDKISSAAKELLCPIRLVAPSNFIDVPIVVAGKNNNGVNLKEPVADLNGLAIPAMLELEFAGTVTMYENLEFYSNDHIDPIHPLVLSRFNSLRKPSEMTDPSHFLELAAIYQAGANEAGGSRGFISKVLQIESFNWMSSENAEKCKNVLRNAVVQSEESSGSLRFEVLKVLKFDTKKYSNDPNDEKTIILKGLIDIESENTIWEIKCVQNLTDEHFIQLGIYAWLYNNLNENKQSYKLLNVLNGEIWEIKTNNLQDTMNILLSYYFRKVVNEDDENFISKAVKLVNNLKS